MLVTVITSTDSNSLGEVKIFDGDVEIVSFNDHAGSANALALHPGRRILASVGDDKTVVLYDVIKSVKLAQFATEDCRCHAMKLHWDDEADDHSPHCV